MSTKRTQIKSQRGHMGGGHKLKSLHRGLRLESLHCGHKEDTNKKPAWAHGGRTTQIKKPALWAQDTN